MHPVSLLESRVANVVELEKYRTPTGTLQARTAVAVLREWLNDKLDESWGAARSNLESVLRLTESRVGVAAVAFHNVVPLSAIPLHHPSLPEAFTNGRYRRCKDKTEQAIEAARASSPGGTRK